MEVHSTPEQEAMLSQVASHAGTDGERLLKEAALRLLERDTPFPRQSTRRHPQADRRELIEEDEMEARTERMLEPPR